MPQRDWHLTGAVFVTDNEATGSTALLSRANNRRLPETPSVSARLGLVRDLALGRDTILSTRGGGLCRPLGAGCRRHVRRPAGGYGVANLGLTARRGGYALALTFDNLLDERGNRFAYGNPFLLGRRNVSTPLRPRTVGVRLSADF
ncbi:hypothetical protein GCM10020258_00120 [Sphingomonas yabuuchiae]